MEMGDPGLWAHFSHSSHTLEIPNSLEFLPSLLVTCSLPGLILLFSITIIFFHPLRRQSDLPLINSGKGGIGILRGLRSRKTYAAELPRLVAEGLSKVLISSPACRTN